MLTAFTDDHDHLPQLGSAFLDCGAYSVLTGQWDELPLSDYYTFVADHHQSFKLLAAPDVIGSARRTYDNLRAFIHAMKQAKVWSKIRGRVLVTYHLGDRDFGMMREMLAFAWDQGIRWLAVGGIVTPGTNLQQRITAIEAVTRQARLAHDWKIHLFGGYHPELIRIFRPDSVDSSTYIAAAKTLQITGYRGWKMFKQSVSRKNEVLQLDQIMRRMDELGILPIGIRLAAENRTLIREELIGMPDGIRLWLINVAGVVAFEEFVRDKLRKPDFRFWVTIDVTMPQAVMRYGQRLQELFWDGWGNRCLLAYPSFWQGHNQEHKHTNLIEGMLR